MVKWGVLVHLARKHGARTIFQVAMCRAEPSELSLRGSSEGPFALGEAVWEHFRNMEDIKRLESPAQLNIEVYRQGFDATKNGWRSTYFEGVYKRIQALARPLVAFVDPDTGIAPRQATHRHVLSEELQRLFEYLKSGDLLVCYQHRWRNRHWQVEARKRLAEALRLPLDEIGIFASDCRLLPGDVILLVARKS